MKIYRAHKLLNCAAAMTIAVASFGAPVYAQTVSAGAETDDNLIIVTATRSEQALNKVPSLPTDFEGKVKIKNWCVATLGSDSYLYTDRCPWGLAGW
jgi:hypothetical protein